MQPGKMQALKAGFSWTHQLHLKGCAWRVQITSLSPLEVLTYMSS